MKAIIELCFRYHHSRITVLEFRKGLIHEIGRASDDDMAEIALLVLKGTWEELQ